MPRPFSTLVALATLVGCASQTRPAGTGSEPLPDGVVQYRCESGEQFAARIQGVSAQIQYNGATYTLPQLSNVAGVQSFSDGRYVLELRQGRTWFGIGRSALRQCTAR